MCNDVYISLFAYEFASIDGKSRTDSNENERWWWWHITTILQYVYKSEQQNDISMIWGQSYLLGTSLPQNKKIYLNFENKKNRNFVNFENFEVFELKKK